MDEPPFRVILIGYWRSEAEPHWPDPHELIDPSWDRAEREWVAEYLAGGQRAPWVAMGYSYCRICGARVGSLEFLDGTYLWPEGLAHYVLEHSVRLPQVILDRIEAWDEGDNWLVDRTWWLHASGGGPASSPPAPPSPRPDENRT